ncbi:DUF1127 domain-containing protein [Pseudoroseicyclus aestuarii]|uniref:Uncharacterized protein YjiS (DUF1127 family) n=1 Tax=Pseudoroseicyclus aestuarii TaxID=1795041 RepID=A0A318SR27_9RHOB|nr:uncharacterized protein YjiS (DUF1127 family) [Pseudoroseicyclus aestuarii]
MTSISATSHSASNTTGGIMRGLRMLASILGDWNDARVTRRALSRLSARELDDIGLTRFDIEAVATRSGQFR